MVLALAALAASAASFPTGFGFGAGYGAGVRVGYDIIYPKIAPALRNIAEDIIGAVNNLFGEGGAPTSSVPSGFDFAAGDKERGPIENVAAGITSGGGTTKVSKAAVVGEAAGACGTFDNVLRNMINNIRTMQVQINELGERIPAASARIKAGLVESRDRLSNKRNRLSEDIQRHVGSNSACASQFEF